MSNILCRRYASTILLVFLSMLAFSQTPKRICVMGSSSAYGFFGNPEQYPKDSAWAYRLKQYYKNLGVIDTLYNLGVNGADPYDGMPTGFIPPPGRPVPDVNHNITKALNYAVKPDILIVNFPTNHYDWLTPAEIISCLQVIRDSAVAHNIQCYITTTQPRDNFSLAERQRLKDLRTLILSTFGYWTLDFWSDVVVDSNLKIKPELAFGDQVHLNPSGHVFLFNKVVAKNLFFTALPAQFGTVNATRQADRALVSWQVFQESDNEKFVVERSHNGVDYTFAGNVPSRGNSSLMQAYSFVDNENSSGNIFYRIAAVNRAGQYQYSPMALLKAVPGDVRKDLVYPTITNDRLTLLLASGKKENVELVITDAQGKKIMRSNAVINNNELYSLNVAQLHAGSYVLSTMYGGKVQSHRFVKL